RAYARRKQLRQIEWERAEYTVDACTNEKQHRKPGGGSQVETERREKGDGGEEEVDDEHRASAQRFGQGYGGERAHESSDVESVGRARLPRLCQKARRIGGQTEMRRVFPGQRAAQQGDERVARPPGQQCGHGDRDATDGQLEGAGSEQLPR